MRALIIGEAEREKIAVLKAKAAGRIVDAARAALEDPDAVRARNTDLNIYLPVGFSITYTVEKQPVGLCEHVSISVDSEIGLGPNPHAVELILESFGMRPLASSDGAWNEYYAPNAFAVNVLQKITSLPVR